MAKFEEDPMDFEMDNVDENVSSSSSRQGSESRQQSVEYGQEGTELNTANGSSFGDEFGDSALPVADLRVRLSNATSYLEKPSFLGLDGAGDTPLETSKAPSQEGGEEAPPVNVSSADVDHRLRSLWNIHDARRIAKDYDGKKEGLDELWKKQFGEKKRPKAYTAETVERGEFLPMTDPEAFMDLLKNPESKSKDELYAVTANVGNALKSWQDEHIAIGELLAKHIEVPKPKTKHPKFLHPHNPVGYEDRKEAMLYGYPHVTEKKKLSRVDLKRGLQDPFQQGGFKATPAQLKRMQPEAEDTNNIDGWDPIVRNEQPLIPAMRPLEQEEPKKPAEPKYETSGVGEMGMEKDKKKGDQTSSGESPRPAKRQTRSHVGKETATVTARATPAETTTAEPAEQAEPAETQTAPPSPPRRGRPPRANPKPRGRPPAANKAANKAAKAQASPKPLPTPPVPAATPHPSSDPGPDPVPAPEKPPRRKRAPRAKKAAAADRSSSSAKPDQPGATDLPTIPEPPVNPDSAEKLDLPSILADNPGLAAIMAEKTEFTSILAEKPHIALILTNMLGLAAKFADKPDLMAIFDDEDYLLLPEDQLIKVTESPNPARTKAMMLHWVGFRKDGRQRKPKRTKAEIEADKAANGENGGSETPKKTPEPKKKPGKPGRPRNSARKSVPPAGQADVIGNQQVVGQGQQNAGQGQQAGGQPAPELAPGTNFGSAHAPSVQASASLGHVTAGQYGQIPPGGNPG